MAAILLLGSTIGPSWGAQDTAVPAKHPKKPHATTHATALPAGEGESTHRVPMDFSGMDKSVKDIRNPSNARSNGQFNGDTGTSGTGFSPGATFKF